MWIIGDVHGRFHTLKALISFLPKDEEIILTGDLIDRGLWSKEVVDFVKATNNVSSVLGNHDEFVILNEEYLHKVNGGFWFYDLSKEDQDEIRNYLSTLPLSKLIKENGAEAVVTHAPMSSPSRQAMLWERNINADLVPDFNIFGHNIVKDAIVLDDRAAIDTGMEKLTAIHWHSLDVEIMHTLKEDVSPLMWEKINERTQ